MKTETPPKRGRGRLPEPPKVPTNIAENMKAASTLWEIPMHIIKAAKAKGCPAFKQQRVYRDALIQWLKDNPEVMNGGDESAGESELKRRKLLVQIQAIEYKLEKDKGEQVSISTVKEEWARGLAIVFEEAKQLMDQEIYQVFTTRCKAKL